MTTILFVKTSSLGDVVHNLPAVSDVARALPGAAIDWVVEEPFAGIATMHPAVRRVIPVAVRRWRSGLWRPAVWSEMREWRRGLRGERYDAVMHFAASIEAGESMRDPGKFFTNNTVGSLNLMEACVRHDVRRFVLSSTAALFAGSDEPLSEEARIDPANGNVLANLDLPGISVSGVESDGADRFFCGGGESGKVHIVRRA